MDSAKRYEADLQWVIESAKKCKELEIQRKLPERNALAQDIFETMRHVKYKDAEVETWYDRSTRNYITQFKVNGDQQGEADYSGNVDSASVFHTWKIYDLLKREKMIE